MDRRVVTALAAGVLIAVLSLAGPAAAQTSSTRVPLSFAVGTCAGDFVTVEGTLHLLRVEDDPNTYLASFQGQGTSTSGTEYVVFLSSTFRHNFVAGDGEAFTNAISDLVIARGETLPADDGLVHVAIHFTIIDGEVVVTFENGTGVCQ